MDAVHPKVPLVDEDDRVLAECLDVEGVFVELAKCDEDLTVEILGCLLAQRVRDYLEGSERYRRRNPLDALWLRMLDAAGEPLVDFWTGDIIDWRPSRLDPERVDLLARWPSSAAAGSGWLKESIVRRGACTASMEPMSPTRPPSTLRWERALFSTSGTPPGNSC